MKPNKTQLENAAKELTKLMNLDPPIPVGKKIKVDALKADIRESSAELVEGEHLSDATLAVLTALGIAHKPKPSKPDKPKPAPRYTRMAAVTDALRAAKKPLSKAEWTERADKLYTDHGGKSNLNETKWSLNYVIGVLSGLDITIETEAGYQLKG